MSKTTALLQIEPQSELKFKGPFTGVVPSEIQLQSLSKKNICFKIKTTAPKQYCVRPNCGIIEPGKKVNVSVVLQPLEADSKEKVKHKFLVLSMLLPDKPFETVEQLWKDPPRDAIYDIKLRCVFELPFEMAPGMEKTLTSEEQEKIGSKAKRLVIGKAKDSVKFDQKKLEEENKQLKEEIQRLKKLMMNSSTANFRPLPLRSPASFPSAINFFVAGMIAIMAITFGLVLGKYFV